MSQEMPPENVGATLLHAQQRADVLQQALAHKAAERARRERAARPSLRRIAIGIWPMSVLFALGVLLALVATGVDAVSALLAGISRGISTVCQWVMGGARRCIGLRPVGWVDPDATTVNPAAARANGETSYEWE